MTITPEAASAAAQILAVLTLAVIFDPTLRGQLRRRRPHQKRARNLTANVTASMVTIGVDFYLALTTTTATGAWAGSILMLNLAALLYIGFEVLRSMQAHLEEPGDEEVDRDNQ